MGKDQTHWWHDVESSLREIPAGGCVVYEPHAPLVCVDRGVVLVRYLDEAETAFVLARRGPASVGLHAVVGTSIRFELHAVTDATVREVSVDRARELLESLPMSARRLAQDLAGGLRSCIEDRVAMSGSAPVRVVQLLLDGRGGDIPLAQLRRHHWAEVLGMRPETLSRELKQLEREGLVRVTTERVEVLDWDGLEARLDQVR